MHVLVVGPGLMGAPIGCEYALGGDQVTFLGRRLPAARDRVDAAFDLVKRFQLAEPEAIARARESIRFTDQSPEVGDDIDLIVESVTEDLAVKAEALRPLTERFPDAIIASNTSSISISKIGDAAGAPERTVGAHYWNPPLLMPLVELISGEQTAPAVVDTVEAELQRLGKRPVRVERDVPGFVWNRLQFALLREAAWIVGQGVATPAVVDEIVRDGLARRWRLTGPFETAALGGAETFTLISNLLFPELSTAESLEDLERWLTYSPEELAAAKDRRDAELLAELKRDKAS
jgi:3-hydroxybutyryl-CoA dehydrogenase